MIHSSITANLAKHANANEVRGRERRTRFLLLTSLFSLLALSGCGTLSLTSDAIDPATGAHLGPGIVSSVTGAPVATLSGAAQAAQGGLPGLAGWGLSVALGIGTALASRKASKATAALDQTTTAVETLKGTAPAAWDALAPLLRVSLTHASEALISRMQEHPAEVKSEK
jgi:hypothetical protein